MTVILKVTDMSGNERYRVLNVGEQIYTNRKSIELVAEGDVRAEAIDDGSPSGKPLGEYGRQ